MVITWRDGQYKYRPALLAYVNNIQVAAVSWLPNKEGVYNAHCKLPGIKPDNGRYPNSALAIDAVEKKVKNWFELVKQ